jgi:hypothetical protein
LLSTCGQQFLDWSAAYRLFSHHRVSTDRLFDNVHHAVQVLLPSSQPLCLAIDDTLLRRTGTHTHGVAWRRDPLGPKFHTNFVRAQRYLQISAAVPSQQNPNAVRMVPLDFWHCPTPVRPRAKATAEQKTQYRQDAKRMNLSVQLIARLQRLCNPAPTDPHSPRRPIHLLVDGQYTNGRVLKNLPPGTTLIGRIRKDAKLYYQPIAAASARRGRRRSYGALAPTPEQIRTTEDPWETVEVFAAGITHQCRVKTVTGLLWRTAGLGLLLKLVVIAPLHYRPRSGSKLLYRRPAFLICTDPALTTQQIVQQYVWRWDIEVNFREEKSLLGVGDGQVRTVQATQCLPAFQVAAYSMLLLAALRLPTADHDLLPPTKWAAHTKPQRASTEHVLHCLRADVWGRGLGLETNFSDFLENIKSDAKSEKFRPSLPSALFYCNA